MVILGQVAVLIIGVDFGFLGSMLDPAVFDMSMITTAFISMFGMGVGIDRSFFIAMRFREARDAGLSVENSVVTAVDTAGRAVTSTGTIVMVVLLGLFVVASCLSDFSARAAPLWSSSASWSRTGCSLRS